MGFGIQSTGSVTDVWNKQQAIRQQQMGLVGTGASLSSVTNVSDKEGKAKQLELASSFSFSEQLKSSTEAQQGITGTNNPEEMSANAASSVSGDREFFNPDDYLTDDDRAFLDKLQLPDDIKGLIKGSIGMDRFYGKDNPLDANYFLGQNGLLNIVPAFTLYAISNSSTATTTGVANEMGNMGNSILNALVESGLATKDDIAEYQNQLAGFGMASWVQAFKENFESNNNLMDLLNDPEKRSKIKDGGIMAEANNMIDYITESKGQLTQGA